MFVALDEDRLQRREHIGAAADLDHLERVHGVDDGAGPNRDSGRAQRAGKADDVVGHLTGRGREMIDGHWTTRFATRPSFRDGALAPDPESLDSPMCDCTS